MSLSIVSELIMAGEAFREKKRPEKREGKRCRLKGRKKRSAQ
jgi:hypothetical protein